MGSEIQASFASVGGGRRDGKLDKTGPEAKIYSHDLRF